MISVSESSSSRMDDSPNNKSMTTIIMISSDSSVIINNSSECQAGRRKTSTTTLDEDEDSSSSSSSSSDFDDNVNTGTDVTASPKSSTSSTLSSGIESGISVTSSSKPLVNFLVERSSSTRGGLIDCHKTRSLDRTRQLRQQTQQQQPSSFCTVSRRRRRSRFASIVEEDGSEEAAAGVSLKPIGSVLPTGWHRHPHVFKETAAATVGPYSTVGRCHRSGFKGSTFEPSPAAAATVGASIKSNTCLLQRRHTTYTTNVGVKPQQLQRQQLLLPPSAASNPNKHVHSWHKTFDAVRMQLVQP